MKRISKLLLLSLTLILPFSLTFAQEKKTEKKIKIVVDDGSGSKTVVDTVLTGSSSSDIITLKNGKIIVLDEPGTISYSDSDKDNILVMVTNSDEGDKTSEKTVVIKKGKLQKDDGMKKFDVYVSTGEEKDDNNTRFIMAKNGLVITVEGKDEAKVEAFRKKIEDLLDEGEKEEIKE